ncbi:hypothetical protein PBI_SCTP2_231 [Salicola phage SCTP-2]|nr:hypothetical protein PBI_SCTP2_231 [Salicola phage SCTP-2]
MAINDSSKLDFLWKKIQYGVTNTSVLGKNGYEEIYGSEVPTYANNIWTQSSQIQKPAPNATTGVHEFYDAANAIECTPDPTVPNNQTWLVTTTYGDTNTLTGDWIPPTFDASYLIQVYAGDPNNGGVALNQGTTGEEWVFDYVAGTVTFVNNVPSSVGDADSSERIFVVGHRYVGSKGLTGAGGAAASEEVADISERDALNPSVGTIAFVVDASGDTTNSAHIGANESATYLYTSSGWRLLSTEDSARADVGTVTYMIDTATTNSVVYTIPANTRLEEAVVEVQTAFDTTPVINVGDSTVNDRIVADNLVDLEEIQDYKVEVNYRYGSQTDIQIEFNPNSATQGLAYLILKWSS